MFKSVVKVCGSTVKLQLILDILSAVEAGGIRGVAVKPDRPAHQLGTGGSGTDAQKLLGGRTGGAEAWCNHAAG